MTNVVSDLAANSEELPVQGLVAVRFRRPLQDVLAEINRKMTVCVVRTVKGMLRQHRQQS